MNDSTQRTSNIGFIAIVVVLLVIIIGAGVGTGLVMLYNIGREAQRQEQEALKKRDRADGAEVNPPSGGQPLRSSRRRDEYELAIANHNKLISEGRAAEARRLYWSQPLKNMTSEEDVGELFLGAEGVFPREFKLLDKGSYIDEHHGRVMTYDIALRIKGMDLEGGQMRLRYLMIREGDRPKILDIVPQEPSE